MDCRNQLEMKSLEIIQAEDIEILGVSNQPRIYENNDYAGLHLVCLDSVWW